MPKLRPSQSKAVEVIKSRPTLLLADVGSGKTATALSALYYRTGRTMVLSTVRICKEVWPEEVKIWAPHLQYANAAGRPPAKRRQVLEGDTDIVGLNFENLAWAVETYGEQLPQMFPNLIIDESSRLENPAAKSTRALYGVLDKFAWRLAMTGTPRANFLADLWGHARLIDGGKALGKHRLAFYQKWFYPVKTPFGEQWIPKPGAENEIYARLGEVCYRMVYDGDRPEVVEQDIMIPRPAVVTRWQKYIQEGLEEGKSTITVDGVTMVRNGHTLLTKALQLSSGFLYRDNGTTLHLHTAKLDILTELVREAAGEPMLVVYQFDEERQAILDRFPQARVLAEDPDAVVKWNAGEIPILLLHPRSAGHGLNLQKGGNLIVWFSPTTDGELYGQTVGRLARSGQTSPLVRVLRLVMQYTEDARCYAVVQNRQNEERKALDILE